ncbi:ribonuclease D [Oceanospirillum multiglobuliferum]|uniref:Ribonuclease D n=1 Tax=Oceanospirillum multiglobuliferum TaxID=64969 RepID=A0A1V4T7N6_9GAMM|nr:ribonuclease D [Oceanospirillum multiglobuliferum]
MPAQSLTPADEQAIAYRFIADDQLLATCCQQWLNCDFIALDTEFIRVDTYYPKAALIQIQDAEHCWLIDPLKITDWQPFAALLTSEQVLKVLHACSEDLEVFRSLTGVVPAPLMDSQVALAFMGETLSVGYQRMVATWLNIDLHKEETRSDWLQRPLTDSQCAYAAADVHYLYQIWPLIKKQLEDCNRYTWCKLDCEQISQQALLPPDDEFYFLRIKQAWKLSQEKLAVLQDITCWREQQVRLRDIPRSRLLSDNQLWLLAYKLPTNLFELSKIEGLRPSLIKREGNEILDIIEHSRTRSQATWPDSIPSPIGQPYRDWSKALKKKVREIADNQDLPPELLVRKRQVEQVLNKAIRGELNQIPAEWTGWRESIVAQPLFALLNKLASR